MPLPVAVGMEKGVWIPPRGGGASHLWCTCHFYCTRWPLRLRERVEEEERGRHGEDDEREGGRECRRRRGSGWREWECRRGRSRAQGSCGRGRDGAPLELSLRKRMNEKPKVYLFILRDLGGPIGP